LSQAGIHRSPERRINRIIDHVIDEERRITRAEQRAATRLSLLEATGECLIEEGYAALTTRRVAERAGVAQSTLMHYFPTREALLVEAVTHLATTLADDVLEELDLGALREPEQREAVIDRAWREFSSPSSLAVAQLWAAVWSEPELAPVLRSLEERIGAIVEVTAGALFPAQTEDPGFPALLDVAIFLIRGLLMAIPIWGRESVDERWDQMKPILLEAAARLLDEKPAEV